MEVFVVKTLVEGMDMNSCSADVFEKEEDAIKFANEEIDNYGMDYNGVVSERSPHYYFMQSGDVYVTIEISKQAIR